MKEEPIKRPETLDVPDNVRRRIIELEKLAATWPRLWRETR